MVKVEPEPKINNFCSATLVLSRLLFDFYLVDLVPRKSFIPWKPHQPFNKLKRKTKAGQQQYHHLSLSSMLIIIAKLKWINHCCQVPAIFYRINTGNPSKIPEPDFGL